MDLLEYAQQLVNQGNTTNQVQAHRVYLQELVSEKQPSAEIKMQASNDSQNNAKSPSANAYLL
jgi:hypothetical protein